MDGSLLVSFEEISLGELAARLFDGVTPCRPQESSMRTRKNASIEKPAAERLPTTLAPGQRGPGRSRRHHTRYSGGMLSGSQTKSPGRTGERPGLRRGGGADCNYRPARDRRATEMVPAVAAFGCRIFRPNAQRLSIGIGGSLTTSPLPHHRTYGSVSGGSAD
jgi:hypothetical protein